MKRTRIFKIGLKEQVWSTKYLQFQNYTATLIKIVWCGRRIDISINGVDFTF